MMFLFVVLFVAAYAVAVSWAARHGTRCLGSTAAAALLLIALIGMGLGRYYAVPSLSRLLLYALALTGPIVVLPTAMLAFAPAVRSTRHKSLAIAVLGASLGFVCGFVIVVYGLRVW